jgi:hypothetical protein
MRGFGRSAPVLASLHVGDSPDAAGATSRTRRVPAKQDRGGRIANEHAPLPLFIVIGHLKK